MILAVWLKELRKLVRERGNFVYLLVMPMAFMILFYFLFNQSGTGIKLNIVDADHSALSQQFIGAVKKIPGFQVSEATDGISQVRQEVAQGKLNLAVIIPQGFAAGLAQRQPVNITLATGPNAAQSTGPVSSVLERLGQRFADPNRPPDLVQVKVEQAGGGPAPSIASQIVPGYTVMFVFYIMITILRSMFKERDGGILERVKTTPLKAYQYMLGMWLPQVLAAMVQIFVLFAFGHWLLKLELGNYGLLFLLSLALALCATALGMMLTMLAKGENQGMAMMQFFTLGGAAMAGLWMPLDMLPATMQKIAHILPQYWAMQGYQALLLNTGDRQVVWTGIGMLTAIALVAVGIAATRFKQFARAE